ncbi:hypothetical protein FACS1894201_04720 [Bacteroidia bacterium]|nr:hypothetical protein FACS1894201_04720 [Bacteroidia bacterium]
MIATAIFAFASCKKEKGAPKQQLPDYIAFDKNHGDDLGDQIDCAIFGKDGIGYLYDFQDENPNIPQRLLIYDNNKDSLNLVINFDEDGLPKNILSENFTVVLGNYVGNKFSAIVVTNDGERHTFENIETEVFWDEYKAELSEVALESSVQMKASASVITDAWKVVNTVVGAAGCGLSYLTLDIIGMLGCDGPFRDLVNAIGWSELLEIVDDNATLINYINCARGIVRANPSRLWSCIESLTDGAVKMNEAWDNDANWDRVVKGLTKDINNFLSDKYANALTDLGFVVNGGYTPPNIDGTYLATPLTLVKKSFSTNVAAQWDMYVTFSGQNNSKLTINVDYDMQSDNGLMEASGPGSFIVGEGKKFSVFVEGTRKALGYTAKTVEVFSGEMTDNGIKNYQWGVMMIDDNGDPTGLWIANGTGYLKKDSDGFSSKITYRSKSSPSKAPRQVQQSNKNTNGNATM